MAQAALRKCAEPGCRTLVRAVRCDRHKKEYRPDKNRANSNERGYTYKWQQFRKAWLAKHPLCVFCLEQGRTTPATDVDHIVPHHGDRVLFWKDIRNNVQGSCRACHSRKTGAGQ